ncbi:MAG: Fe-S cluster assembly protein SufB, partial [Atopobiaceae bacterium]|nr:Fe-S cluster assembly protein SufB [Atopobiaceae bacterium]
MSAVAEVDASLYDFVKPEPASAGYERFADGLTPEVVERISRRKDEPSWMLDLRLASLETYRKLDMPRNWGPSIAGLDMDHISTYVTANAGESADWDDVPADIKDTF